MDLLNSFRDVYDLSLKQNWTTSLVRFCGFIAALWLKERSQPDLIIPFVFLFINSTRFFFSYTDRFTVNVFLRD